MADATTLDLKIEFIEHHIPALEDGDYFVTVEQTIEADGVALEKLPFSSGERRFTVAGDRFSLKPDDIYKVFPPAGSLGDHSNVLPHVVLKRSTLPWERETGAGRGVSWLALLLFGEEEAPTEKGEHPTLHVITLDTLMKTPLTEAKFPSITLEGARAGGDKVAAIQDVKDKVTVIDVKKSLLKKILPTAKDLGYLAHVRQGTDAAGRPSGEELAVVICNRLPVNGGISTVHLVSVEDRYKGGGDLDYQDAQEDDLVRLVSLKSWSFACLDEKQSFKGILTNINNGSSLFRVGDLRDPSGLAAKLRDAQNPLSVYVRNKFPTEARKQLDEFDGSGSVPEALPGALADGLNQAVRDSSLFDEQRFAQVKLTKETLKFIAEKPAGGDALFRLNRLLLEEAYPLEIAKSPDHDPGVLRLPGKGSPEADKYYARGFVPVAYRMRGGERSVSFYHGPLAPGAHTSDVPLPVPAGDALLRFDPSIGMFDVSYAAAWELGRLLALQSKPFSVGLFHWKRANARRLKQAEQQLLHPHLPSAARADDDGAMPTALTSWLNDLSLLKGVPFNYLVPDERMLPRESIRFFQLDGLWVECLLDGAFSVGRVATSDHARDKLVDVPQAAGAAREQVTGFLLRSDAVSGWPGLLADAWPSLLDDNGTPDGEQLTCLRIERLSPNVLICLFAGEVTTLRLHLKPEDLHFGIDTPDHDNNFLHKKLRDSWGREENRVISLERKENTEENTVIKKFHWRQRPEDTTRTLDITSLAEDIRDKLNYSDSGFTSAQFGLEMIEGVDMVVFKRQP